MGISLRLQSIPREQFQALLENSVLVDDLLNDDERYAMLHRHLDIGKSWHGIHYLLTGSAAAVAGPLSYAILGGTRILKDGKPISTSYLSPEQVRALASALDLTSAADLRERFDPNAMKAHAIYPTVIWKENPDDELEILLDDFQRLVAFYRTNANRGDAVLQVFY
jgi:hypothetical protein